MVGSIGFTTLAVGTNPWSLWPWLLLRGFGFGSTGVPLQNLALARVSNLAMARASSLVNVTRQIAGAIGVAALTSYLTTRATFHGTQRTEILTQCSGFLRDLPMLRTCATKYVEVQALDAKGKPLVFRCGGLLARAVQHEADHLNGLLFIDRMEKKMKLELQPELDELQAKTKSEMKK